MDGFFGSGGKELASKSCRSLNSRFCFAVVSKVDFLFFFLSFLVNILLFFSIFHPPHEMVKITDNEGWLRVLDVGVCVCVGSSHCLYDLKAYIHSLTLYLWCNSLSFLKDRLYFSYQFSKRVKPTRQCAG